MSKTLITDEDIKSIFRHLSGYKGYPSGYKPKSISQQTKILRQLFPDIDFANKNIANQQLPKNAEGWFAIPRWQTIDETYGGAIQKVLDLIKQTQTGKFHNYLKGQLDLEHLRQNAKTAKMFQRLEVQQKDHDILVVAAQFGLRHRGRSVRQARKVMNSKEFGLGAFAVGIMILTHPERLQHFDDLWIDCAGDEFAPHANGDFSAVPRFQFCCDRIEFSARWIDDDMDVYGSASAFLPQ
jgi:hypothetical protein